MIKKVKPQQVTVVPTTTSTDEIATTVDNNCITSFLNDDDENDDFVWTTTPDKISDSSKNNLIYSSSKRPLKLEFRYIYIPFISRISTSELLLDCRVDFDLLWLASREDIKAFEENPSEYRPKSYMPSLVFQNSKEVDVFEVTSATGSPYKIENGKNFVRLKVNGSFLQNFNVGFFPFDHQTMRVVVTISFKNADELIFCPENSNCDVLYVLTEYNALKDWKITGCELEYYVDNSNFAFVEVLISISRVPWNIVFNYLLIALFISTVGLCSYNMTDKSSRLGFLITVMLTIIALQYSVTDRLPPSPYLTFSDYYMFINFGFIGGIIFQSLSAVPDENGQLNDSKEYYTAIMLLVSINVFFITVALFVYFKGGTFLNLRKKSHDAKPFLARWPPVIGAK